MLDQGPVGPGQHRRQLIRVDEPAAAGPQDLGRVVVQGLEQVGRGFLDRQRDAGAGLDAEAHGHGRGHAARDSHPALGEDLLDPGAVGQRPDLVAEGGEAALVDLDDGPDVDPHVVHVELRARGTPSDPGSPDRLQAALHGAFGVWEGGDPAVVVADHSELTHLREGHQPPVRGVLAGDALVQQDVLRRLDPRDVEVAQAPEVQAPADHRMDAAREVVLGHLAVVAGPEGEVAHRLAAAGADRDRDAAYVVGERQRLDQREQVLARGIGRLRCVGPVQVEVDHGLMTLAPAREVGADRGRQPGRRVGQLGHRAQGRHQPRGAVVERVVGDDEGPVVGLDRREVVQLVLAVVAPSQHLEHRLAGRHAVLQPLGQEPDDLLRDGRQRVDSLGPVRQAAVRGQRGQLVAHSGEDVGAVRIDGRLVEPAEPDAAGQVSDHGEPQLGGPAEAFEQLPGLSGELTGRRRLVDPAAEHRGRQRDLGSRPLLRHEDPEDALLHVLRAVEVLDPVVVQHAEEPVPELLGQAAALDVEALQEGVEVLAGAVDAQLRVTLLVGGLVAAELGQVGQRAEQSHLVGQHRDALGPELLADVEVVLQRALLVHRRHVVAEDDGLEGGPGPGRALHDRLSGLGRRQVQLGGGLRGGVCLLGAVRDRLELDQRGAGLDQAPGDDRQLPDLGGERCVEHRLHLHRLEHHHGCARLDLLADADGRGNDQGRGRRAEHAALVAADPVGHAVDLDQRARAVGGGDHVVAAAADDQATVELVDPVHADVDGLLGRAGGDRDAVAGRSGVDRGHPVRRTAELELNGLTRLVLSLRTTTMGGLEQPGDLDPELVRVGLDRGAHDRDPGMLLRDQPAFAAHPVDPAGVGPPTRAVDDLGLVEQVEHEALVGGAALDHHDGLGHRSAQTGEGLLAGRRVGDDLGDHRVEVGGDRVPFGDSRVDADSGPRRQLEPDDAPGGRGEVAIGVLGVQARLDGVPLLGWPLTLEPAAPGNQDLGLHEVDVGRGLGDRVLDLQPGVDLEEREGLLAGVVEELHGARADIADGQGEALRRGLQLVGLLAGQQG